MKKITDRMLSGGGGRKIPQTLKNVADNIAGRTICAFGEACAWPTQSFVAKFRDEFADARKSQCRPPPAGIHAGGTNRRRGNPHRVAGRRFRMGKKPVHREQSNLETRKPEKESGIEGFIERIIGAAIRVHTELGPGFIESLYEEALAIELRALGIQFQPTKNQSQFFIGRNRLVSIGSMASKRRCCRAKGNNRVRESSLCCPSLLSQSARNHRTVFFSTSPPRV